MCVEPESFFYDLSMTPIFEFLLLLFLWSEYLCPLKITMLKHGPR